MRKVEDIEDWRRDLPDQEAIRHIANRAYTSAQLGKVSSMVTVQILNGGTVQSGCVVGLSDQERLLLLGELEMLKAAILRG